MNQPLPAASGKSVFIVLVLLLASFVQLTAQSVIGRQKVDQYSTTPWNTSTYGLTWLPTDYSVNTNQKYPLIIFLHGSGEGGDGVGGLYNLASQGLPHLIANGFNPEAVNPVDGQNYKFIVISPQAPWSMRWSYGYAVIKYILEDVVSRYRVDPERIYVTGLSAGGSGTYSCVTNGSSFAQKFAAVVPVCPAGTNTTSEFDQLPLVGGTYGVKVWSPVGATDALYSFAQLAVNTINSGSPAPAVPAVVSAIPGVGHEPAGWNMAYTPTWRSNNHNLNIYEWMLKYKRGSNSNGNNNLVPTANAGSDQSITFPVTSVQLNGSGSDPDGYITSYSWTQENGPSNANFSNRNISNPTVGNLAAGSYTFRLTVKDNYGNGATASDVVVITVNPASNQVPVVSAGNSQSITLPSNSVTVSGNASDADGWITSYFWTQLSGPANANISNASSAAATFSGLVQGTYSFRLKATDNAFSYATSDVQIIVNPAAAVAGVTIPGKIEAESFSGMYGIGTEYTWDGGWGQNVGWQDNNDWMDYQVNVTAPGNYKINFRLATPNNGVQFQVKKSDGSVLTTVTVPNTGWWHNWQTISATVFLTAGQQTLRINTSDDKGSGWNINWMEFVAVATPPAPPASGSIKIEAEEYSSMHGIQTETTTDAGGGRNVGWQDNQDWMNYPVNISTAGTYTVNFRVASMFSGAHFQLRKLDGGVLANVTVPNTGNFQAWQTVSASVTLPAGQQTLRIVTIQDNGGWNFNWMEIISGGPVGSRIEAENYSGMYGIQTESTLDAGGGLNVGWQDNNDWMDYAVTPATTGLYTVDFRVASMFSGARFELRKQDGTALATIAVPNTGNFQNWQTVSATVSLPSGYQVLRIVTIQDNGGWNLNWLELKNGAAERTARTQAAPENSDVATKESIETYPNPVRDRIMVNISNQQKGTVSMQLFNMGGSMVKQVNVSKPSEGMIQTQIQVKDLPKGSYMLKMTMGKWTQTRKIIKQ